MPITEFLLQPVAQFGFLGFSVVLLAVVIWLIRRLLDVLDATNKIIASNTEAVNDLTALTGDLVNMHRALHDKIISRPCIARKENG